MKSFIKQCKECVESGVCEMIPTKETEIIYGSVFGPSKVEINNANFCHKYMKRCSSKVCLNERKKL